MLKMRRFDFNQHRNVSEIINGFKANKFKKNVIKVEIRIEWSGLSFGNVSHNLEFK